VRTNGPPLRLAVADRAPVIRCRTLGPVEVEVNGAPAPPELLWRKNLALLLYLARSPHGTRSREHLVGLLWAAKPEAAARHSLAEAIRTLRNALGDDGLMTSANQVRLQADAVQLDVDELERLAAVGDWAGAAALAGGTFCEGLGVADASAFEDWLAIERTRWTGRQVEVLLRRGDDLDRRGFATNAAHAAERALELEPTSEPAIRMLMRSLAIMGDRGAALTRYERFCQDLVERLGVEPDSETLGLFERLRRGQRLWRRRPARPSRVAETRRLPLTGRAPELERLLGSVLASRLAPRAIVAVVEAHPGLGRTRLLEEVTERAAIDAVSVVTARAVAADRREPSSGILGLACGGLLDAPGIAGAQGSALATLAGRITEWAERFRTPAGSESMSLSRAFAEVLRAGLAERPVLIAVDDAQWLDAESYGTLEVLLRDMACEPLALLLSVAAEHTPPELDTLRTRFGRDVNGEVVDLRPLALADVAQLVAHVMPATSDEQRDRLARRVLADSAGLPLLVVELLHAIESGFHPEELAGGWPAPLRTLDHTLPGDLPDTIVAAVRVGFRRLSGEAQRTLSTAAVLGDHVTARDLARITGLGDDATAAALDELEWSRWLLADSRGYTFVARIIRDVVAHDMLTPGQRQRIEERQARFRHGGMA
jgi:DNA-binding SARP family transcriptional activator